MIGLTHNQAKLLAFIASCDLCPSYDEMAAHMGVASKGTVSVIVKGLEERGYIRRLPQRARAIEVLTPPQRAPTPSPGSFINAPPIAAFIPIRGRINLNESKSSHRTPSCSGRG